MEYIQQLLENGEDVNARDEYNNTPLHYAARNGYKEIAGMLILFNADVNALNQELLTPLHYAAAENNKEVTQFLLNVGTNKLAVNKYNHTPEDFAKIFNSYEVIPLFCKDESSFNNSSKNQITLSYNEAIGGTASETIKNALITSKETKVNLVDYLSITSVDNNINSLYMYIYNDLKQETYISFNKAKVFEIFSAAKYNAFKALQHSDGLIIPGNAHMVDPRLFGEGISPDFMQPHGLERNIAEMALIHIATQRGIPMLGICGGCQILNTYFGGKIGDKDSEHNDYVYITPNSELSQIIFGKPNVDSKNEKFWASHQQIVKEIGGGNLITGNQDLFKATAHTNTDIEAIESQFGTPVIGLQFHPEMSPYSSNFSYSEQARDKKIYLAFQQSVSSFHNKQLLLAEFKKSKWYTNTQDSTIEMHKENSHDIHNQSNNSIINIFTESYSYEPINIIGAIEGNLSLLQ